MKQVINLIRKKISNTPFMDNSTDEFVLGYNEALQQILKEVELLDFVMNAPIHEEVNTEEYAETL